MVEKWFVIYWIVIKAISLGVEIAKNGEPNKFKHNAISAMIATVISVIIAYFGGLFRCFEV